MRLTRLVGARAAPGAVLSADPGGPRRLVYVDNLKLVLIAAIIAIHAVLGYAGTVEAWTYTGVREVTLAPAVEAALIVVVGPFGLLLIALLFLVAGLLTPASHERKGSTRFVRDRLVRLGVPFVVYVFVVQPVLVYALEHSWGDAPGSLWQEYLGDRKQVDTGPLWFVGVLLVFSLAHAAWSRLGRSPGTGVRDRSSRPLTLGSLAAAAAIVAPASFAIRLVYPYGSEAGFSDLNFWEWPACIAVFAVGTRAAQHSWLEAVPAHVARGARALTIAGILAMMALLVVAGVTGQVDAALGGWHWIGAAFVVVEAILTVFGSVWLLSVAQHALARPLPHGSELARSAYAAFVLQTVFLLAWAAVLRPFELPAEVKAVLVAAAAVTASFGAAWLLLKRVPGAARIL